MVNNSNNNNTMNNHLSPQSLKVKKDHDISYLLMCSSTGPIRVLYTIHIMSPFYLIFHILFLRKLEPHMKMKSIWQEFMVKLVTKERERPQKILTCITGLKLSLKQKDLLVLLKHRVIILMWSYGSWIYNYLCNLWVRTLFMAKCTWYNMMW